jgi:hypothetical protein
MTDLPTPHGPDEPPFGDATDEAVSAMLDGELDGFAAERGLDRHEVRRRLEAWTGLSARRDELAAARDTVAEATPAPLDELTRRRLVAAAADRLPPVATARPRRGPLLAVAAVVAFLLVGTIAVVATRGGSHPTASKARSSAAAAQKAAEARGSTYVGDLGDVSDPKILRAALERNGASAASASGALTDLGSTPSPKPAASPTSSPSSATRTEAEQCARRLAAGRTSTGPVVLLAGATFQQKPALVVAVADRGRVVAFVVAPGSCDVLSAQSL